MSVVQYLCKKCKEVTSGFDGGEIRRLREEAGMFLRVLAVRVEVSTGQLSKIEQNQTAMNSEMYRRLLREIERFRSEGDD